MHLNANEAHVNQFTIYMKCIGSLTHSLILRDHQFRNRNVPVLNNNIINKMSANETTTTTAAVAVAAVPRTERTNRNKKRKRNKNENETIWNEIKTSFSSIIDFFYFFCFRSFLCVLELHTTQCTRSHNFHPKHHTPHSNRTNERTKTTEWLLLMVFCVWVAASRLLHRVHIIIYLRKSIKWNKKAREGERERLRDCWCIWCVARQSNDIKCYLRLSLRLCVFTCTFVDDIVTHDKCNSRSDTVIRLNQRKGNEIMEMIRATFISWMRGENWFRKYWVWDRRNDALLHTSKHRGERHNMTKSYAARGVHWRATNICNLRMFSVSLSLLNRHSGVHMSPTEIQCFVRRRNGKKMNRNENDFFISLLLLLQRSIFFFCQLFVGLIWS